MLLILGVLLTVAIVIISRWRIVGNVKTAKLGWMSEKWLAEYRASHPT